MNKERIIIIGLKFAGFLGTLITIIIVSYLGGKLIKPDIIIGALCMLLASQGRDLYRSSTHKAENGG